MIEKRDEENYRSTRISTGSSSGGTSPRSSSSSGRTGSRADKVAKEIMDYIAAIRS